MIRLEAASGCSEMMQSWTSLVCCFSILANLGCKALKEFLAHLQRCLDILFAHRFVRMVADAAGTAQKEHRRGHAAAMIMASWPAPLGIDFAGKPAASIASAMNAVRRSSIGTAGSSIFFVPIECQSAAGRNRLGVFDDVVDCCSTRAVVNVANVEA